MTDAGYITDVEYTGGFYGHLAPAWLNYIAAINGYRSRPLDKEFTYCELACGKAVTSVILAAMHPQGRFYAVDMNPNHIRYGQGLAEAGKLENIALLPKSFAEMLLMDLPQFDFITLHGVWSWVPETVRNEIRAIIKHKLKPGGLVMVSYNAMPGWAHIAPLREMMHAYVSALEGDSIARARQALGYLKFLADNKAAYFQNNPAAVEHVQFLLKQDLRYIAHEYITQHSHPFYFGQVRREMTEIGLTYAGNMTPEFNYAELMVPPAFKNFMSRAPSRPVFETHRDFIGNTRFRNDLYAAQSGPVGRLLDDPGLVSACRFGIMRLPEKIELKGQAGMVQYDMTGQSARARAIFDYLAAAPATLEQIHEHTANARPISETSALLMQMVVARCVTPTANQGPVERGWSPLARALVEAALQARESVVHMACPTLNNAVNCALPFALAAQLHHDCDSAEAAGAQATDLLRKHANRLTLRDEKGGEREATEDESRRYFGAAWQKFREEGTEDLRYLRLLGLDR